MPEPVTEQEWETPCPNREDRMHCDCWYDGKACCSCGDPGEQIFEELMEEDDLNV